MKERIAVIGLGYVGLPIAVSFSKKYEVVGFDISEPRVAELNLGQDSTREVEPEKLKAANVLFSTNPEDMKDCTMFIVTVPTPVDENNQPDLRPVISATKSVAKALTKGAIVVYESTVYPGVTEDICRPLLAKESGLTPGTDFKVGYSPERINPGDKEHSIEKITKVVAAEDGESLARVSEVYASIITAGIFKASSIKVAEAAKVIENTQRDINIALMNEVAMIFDRIGIRTADVLEAARTKWNFLNFRPGLVGGHCIGVDPYYLTAKAKLVGYHSQVILAGRKVNDEMGPYVAQKAVKMLVHAGKPVKGSRVGVLGLTFKEDVPDLRNSRVPDILKELSEFGCDVLIHDPNADEAEAMHEYGVKLNKIEDFANLDALVVAVNHHEYIAMGAKALEGLMGSNGVVIDVKSMFKPTDFSANVRYWSL